jgi:DNA invertase Pin-like site-specific DNA recombinase
MPEHRAAIYARVSTVGNGQNPDVQLRELREYCERRGLTIQMLVLRLQCVARVSYVGKQGISKAQQARPGPRQLPHLVPVVSVVKET